VARLTDLSLKDRAFISVYPFRRIKFEPAKLTKPINKIKLAVVTSAAFYLPGQTPFDETKKGGDHSFRPIDRDSNLDDIIVGHRSSSFDHRGIEKDANLALPLNRLRQLVNSQEIGKLAKVHYSFMGGITAPGKFIKNTAPNIAGELKSEDVDAVLLTPV
jgi:D-proline reductase (dithiol) PrdB